MRLHFIYQLHGPHLGGSAERACRKCLSKQSIHIRVFGKIRHHAAHHMDHVGIELYLLQEFHMYLSSAPAQVVAGKVYQHDVLGVLFRIIE